MVLSITVGSYIMKLNSVEEQYSCMVTLRKTVQIPLYQIPSLIIILQVLMVVQLTGRKVLMMVIYTIPLSPTIGLVVMVVQYSGQVTMVKCMIPTLPTILLRVLFLTLMVI